MTTSVLSLPVDVPWKRVAISQDMYATSADQLNPRSLGFLEEWRTSLAVFFYEPEPDPTDTSNEVTTFLKVVASITGFHLHYVLYIRGQTIDIDAFYPTYCAVAQLAVFPVGQSTSDLDQFPYVADFQPKSREVIETRTTTGETVTQTAEPLSVSKSTTNTFSQDAPTLAPTGITETTLTDASRQKRETTSYSTNLAQLYHLLDSYHSGTNRAVFLTMARPHLVDSPYTFVNGPRRMEGVQEFFLVIRRPKTMPGICVAAELETASIDLGDTSGNPATVFITSRAVSGCTGPGGPNILPAGPWVTFELVLPNSVNDLLRASQQSGMQAVVASNALNIALRDIVVGSFSSGRRYPLGTVEMATTNFAMRRILAQVPPEALSREPKALDRMRRVESTLSLSALQLSNTDFATRAELLKLLGPTETAPKTSGQRPGGRQPASRRRSHGNKTD